MSNVEATEAPSTVNDPENVKLEKSADFNGPTENRKCTDVLFFIAMICMWISLTVLGFIGLGWFEDDEIAKGNPLRLINGIDYEGEVCGIDGKSHLGRLYTAYDSDSGAKVGICVEECPRSRGTIYTYDGLQSFDRFATDEFLNYCIIEQAADVVANGGNSGRSDLDGYEEITADIWTASPYIGGFGFAFAFFMGFGYLLFLRIPLMVFLLVWVSLALVLIFVVCGASLALDEASLWRDEDPAEHSETEADALEAFGYLLYVLAFLYTCMLLYLRKRVQLAVGVVKEASRAVGAMPTMIFFPMVQTCGIVLFCVVWLVYGLYLASSGELSTYTTTINGNEITVRQMEYTNKTRGALLYLIFCLFWTLEYIAAMGQIVLSMCVATWYFSRDKGSLGHATVVRCVKRSMWYHTGTAAFGSLILAIIRTIRVIISYMQKKAKASGNKLAQAVLCCLQCCMWCMEKCMRFLNKNAYIQTAMFGYNFCSAAKRAFFLILRNVARVAAVTVVGEFILFIGKVTIVASCAGIAYMCMDDYLADELNGLVAPTLLTAIIAYRVADLFCSVFGMAVSTILQCFIADEEMFQGEERYASGDLRKWVDDNGSEKKKGGEEGAPAEPAV